MIRTKKELNDRALHNENAMPTQQLQLCAHIDIDKAISMKNMVIMTQDHCQRIHSYTIELIRKTITTDPYMIILWNGSVNLNQIIDWAIRIRSLDPQGLFKISLNRKKFYKMSFRLSGED